MPKLIQHLIMCFFIYMALLLLPLSGVAATCRLTTSSTKVQWSEPAIIVAPNRKWQIEVHPNLLSKDNDTRVILRECKNNRSYSLFVLRREAKIYWSSDSKKALVINMPGADVGKIILFNIQNVFADNGRNTSKSEILDGKIRKAVINHLGKEKYIFYLPELVSWKNNDAVFEIAGTASSADVGPMAPYCYGVLVDTKTLEVHGFLSKYDLEREFKGVSCQTFP